MLFPAVEDVILQLGKRTSAHALKHRQTATYILYDFTEFSKVFAHILKKYKEINQADLLRIQTGKNHFHQI